MALSGEHQLVTISVFFRIDIVLRRTGDNMGTWGEFPRGALERDRSTNVNSGRLSEHMAGQTAMLLSLNICGMTFAGGELAPRIAGSCML